MELRMKKSNMKIDLFFICFLPLLFGCKKQVPNNSRVATLPFYNEATFTPKWINPNDITLDTFHRISDFNLTNQEGESISAKTFADKIYVVDFFFTFCPGICPRMMDNMMMVQDEFLKDEEVMLLSHSVTPKADSVSVLKAYAENRGILSDKWHLVTGEQKEIYKLGRKDYFIEEDLGLEMEEDDFLHTENFVLIDKGRHIRGIYNGLSKTSVNQLIEDIKTLKQE